MPTWQTTKGIFSIAGDTQFGRVDLATLDSELRQLVAVTVALDGVTVGKPTADTLILDYRAEPSSSEKIAIEQAVTAHDGVPRVDREAKITELGALEVEVRPRTGSPYEEYSINWCDPTTWWPEAQLVEDQVAVATADPLVFTLPDDRIIDVTHGKITQEHKLSSFAPVVTVNGVVLTEREFGYDDHDPSWGPNPYDAGDYVIDYEQGLLTLFSAPAATPVVDYYRATTGNWYIVPEAGKSLRLLAVEVQFSMDVQMRDSMIFEPQIMAAAAAAAGMLDPSLLASNGGPIADTAYLPISDKAREYRRIMDFIVEAQRSFPVIPAVGGAGARALTQDYVVFRWPYEEAASREVSATAGTRIRIGLKHSIPYGGTFANASCYAVSETV